MSDIVEDLMHDIWYGDNGSELNLTASETADKFTERMKELNLIIEPGWLPIDEKAKDGRSIEVANIDIQDSNQIVAWDHNIPGNPAYTWLRDDAGHLHEDAFTHYRELSAPGMEPPTPTQEHKYCEDGCRYPRSNLKHKRKCLICDNYEPMQGGQDDG